MKYSALGLIVGVSCLGVQAIASPLPPTTNTPQSLSRSCPTDVETLMAMLLRDLPSYANRVNQRSRRIARTTDKTSVYVIVAGHPEFAPLTLGPGEYISDPARVVEAPQQVFITTLERQYTNSKPFEFQNYHWLFLTYTDSGWQLAMMYSRLGSYPATTPPTPPRESSNGIIGQAVRIWLKDCRAGVIRIKPR